MSEIVSISDVDLLRRAVLSCRARRGRPGVKHPWGQAMPCSCAFRDGVIYGTNIADADPDLAWEYSRSRTVLSNTNEGGEG